MFSQTTLGDQSKISLTDPFKIPIKRTIIVGQYYNQQVKFPALWSHYAHRILIACL
uniref:AGO911 n=1 Tax=Arundo donax TaxID=35708 RepID=A0A0A9DRL0_ARUDO